jgi:transposase InsO family protein
VEVARPVRRAGRRNPPIERRQGAPVRPLHLRGDIVRVRVHRVRHDVYSRRIVGWRTASSMTADLVTDALEMAIFSRRHQLLRGVIAHSDAGSQCVSVAYTERLAEIDALPSIGSIGDSFDCEYPWAGGRWLEGSFVPLPAAV